MYRIRGKVVEVPKKGRDKKGVSNFSKTISLKKKDLHD